MGNIILNPLNYSSMAVTAASGALFVDVSGLLGAMWKVVINPESVQKLAPMTSTKQTDGLADAE